MLENAFQLHRFFEAVKVDKKEGATKVTLAKETLLILDSLRYCNMAMYNLLTLITKKSMGDIIIYGNEILESIERKDWQYPEKADIDLELLEPLEQVYEFQKSILRIHFPKPKEVEPEQPQEC
jgi:hypothetical protein